MSWTKLQISGDKPDPREYHSMCSIGNKIYVFGGSKKNGAFNDLWEFDTDSNQWNCLCENGHEGIPLKWGSTITPYQNKLYVYGGEQIDPLNRQELYCYDIQTGEWSNPSQTGNSPIPRMNHTATYIPTKNSILIFGGKKLTSAVELNDLYYLNLDTFKWTSVDIVGDVPPARKRHSSILTFGGDESEEYLLVYGGWQGDNNYTGDYYGDIWSFDITYNQWYLAEGVGGKEPAPRGGFVACKYQDKMVIFGGLGNQKKYFNEIAYLIIDDITWNYWQRSKAPAERFNLTGVIIEDTPNIYMFGGNLGNNEFTNEMLCLNVSGIY
eukprot:TRINITY_DN2174_c0_g1_i1.p1 TRINITY_DN2174_c0_g1~~TRINITY_DN2174_c0_g1_i1.p1  ORF type:complete len:324 (-),score=109.44 TRINITY_DN2174_c0_g1_i1:81-1052(-)